MAGRKTKKWELPFGPDDLPKLSQASVQSKHGRLTAIQQLIVRMRRGEGGEGLDIESIALELGITVAEVREALLIAGMDHRPDSPDSKYGLPQSVIKKVVGDYNAGIQVREIIERHKISVHKIYQILAGEDVPLRSYALPDTDSVERRDLEIIEAYAPLQPDGTRDPHKGLPIAELCKRVGISQMTLHNAIHKYNVPLRQPRKARRSRSMLQLIGAATTVPDGNGNLQLTLYDALTNPVDTPSPENLTSDPIPGPESTLPEWTPWDKV